MLLVLSCASLYGHGAYHEELQRTDEQIAEHPNDGELWFHRGWVNFLHGEWQTSLTDLEKADRLAPGKFATDWIRGQALLTGGKLEAAKTVLDEFLAQHPTHGGAYLSRARVLAKMELWTGALSDFRAALTHTKNAEPDLYIEIADALAQQQQTDEAVQVLASGIQQLGNTPGLVLKALDLELATRRYDAALTRIAAMQSTAPRPEPWMARRAAVLAQAGRIAESRAAWLALQTHLSALPNLQRGSHAMSVLADEAAQALKSLSETSLNASTSSSR